MKFTKSQFLVILTRFGYVFVNLLLQLSSAKVLTKEEFGLFSVGKSLFQFFDFSHLGTRYSLDRLLPAAGRITRIILYTVCSVITGVGSLLVGLFWIVSGYNNIVHILFILAGFIYSLLTLKKVYERSKGNHRDFSRLTLIIDFSATLIQLVCLWLFGFNGIVLAFVGGYLIIFLLTEFKAYVRKIRVFIYVLKIKGDEKIKLLFDYGFLLFLNAFFLYLVNSADRLIIERYYGEVFLADYSFVMMFLSMLIILPSVLIEVQMSKLMIDKSVRYFIKFGVFVLVALIVFSLVTYLVLPFILVFFDKYSHLKNILSIACIASLFSAILQICSVYAQANDYRKYILWANMIGVSIYMTFLFLLIHLDKTLEFFVWNKIIFYASVVLGMLLLLSYKKKVINS